MAPQSRGPSNSHSGEPGKPLKHDQSAEIARLTAEWLAERGLTEPPKVPTPTAEEVIAKVKLKYTQNGKPLE